ncbi:DUF2834 domain-containing protein [Romeria aff. gracilis LEGE 07310]|uniref:DUF2834 domain-containing protein n=1 Tax=Vasconcelosia minhoensis LEGE 07310 TaxID=915328 RepID=A0A8J7A525_9CYAN|nr:DUF2834 domain-containing protein [Romeria gracilis]MBE9076502.1 DUF2834 domain-containing protein [Romeria aff. gracilis LEGE 07310]
MQPTQLSASAQARSFNLRTVYLLLALVGAILPWVVCFEYLQQGNISIHTFFSQALTNSVSSTFVADLLFSEAVFFCFAFVELKRLGISRIWLAAYITLGLTVGLCCSLPLFLYMREGFMHTEAVEN